jgi:hypothetical protein
VDAVYDPLIDLKELQTEQIRTHIALASASELSFQSGTEPTDFTDPVVQSVMDEFARRRLPGRVLQAFAGHFGLADVDQGVLPEGDAEEYYKALFEVLVGYADIPQGALSTLARYRAQAVMDVLVREGVERERLAGSETPQKVEARVDGVPLKFNLNVIRSVMNDEGVEMNTEALSDEPEPDRKQ